MRKFYLEFIKENEEGEMIFATPCVPGHRALGVWKALTSGDATPTHCGTPKFNKNVSYRFFLRIDENNTKWVNIEAKRRFRL